MSAGALIALMAAVCAGHEAPDFAGTWVFRYHAQSILKLTLTVEGGRVAGSLTKPGQVAIDQDGDVTSLNGSTRVVLPVQRARLTKGRLELTIDGDRFLMTLQGPDAASLALPGMRPWRLERAADAHAVVLADSLAEPDYPEEIRSLRERLHAMVAEDQAARMAFDEARTADVDAKNRPKVIQIFDRYGWVTHSLAGKQASHDFWLLVQHQTPGIQRRMLPALEKAARAGDASMSDYAYLYDRVQVGMEKPQRWGTQTKCEKGKPVLAPVEDPAGLDARRRELFMLPARDYLKMDYLVKGCSRNR